MRTVAFIELPTPQTPVYQLPEGCFAFAFNGPTSNVYHFMPGDLLIVDPKPIDNGLVAVKFPRSDIAELRELLTYNEQERIFAPIQNGVAIIHENMETPESERGQVLGRVCRLFRSLEEPYIKKQEESKHEKTRLYLE